ncbi:MAG: alpha/beta hydrolase [Sphingomicrobium sp.]
MKRYSAFAALLAGVVATGMAACSPLTAFNALVPKDRGVVRALVDSPYGSDPRQTLDIYRPSGAAAGLPIIVFFYGGSWNSGTKNGYAWLGRALAARGFVVAIPNYRLVPQAPFPAFIEDGAAAVALVRQIAGKVGGDPARIVLAGHSAGAYNAAMLAYDQRWLGADHRSVKGFIGLAGPYDFLPFKGADIEAAFKGRGDPKATQPVNFIDPGDPPAFLATGSEDRTVHRRNSNALAARLKAAGITAVRKDYPGVGHAGLVTAIAKPLRGRASVLDDMTAFATQVTATH